MMTIAPPCHTISLPLPHDTGSIRPYLHSGLRAQGMEKK